MEEKLESYRRKKSRELLKAKIKNMATSVLISITNVFSTKHKAPDNECIEEPQKESTEMGSSQNSEAWNFFNLKTYVIFVLWLMTYFYFIHIEFGAVYFCICALLFIYFNTRTGRRQRDERSAYSVFNRNCERIDGTFSAEQFEKQLRKGML